ncbi:MAG TPA: DUF4293 domain-containing protein [Cyclobacteriaceae bacterium]|nr:DUF4293 domain-containing protein [Cyclobacteriaceae bacterium]
MWQRIQTVFLAIAAIALIAALVQPLWEGRAGEEKIVLTPFYLLKNEQYAYYPYALTAVLTVAGLTLTFLTIRRYDNRMVQMKLGLFNTLILTGVMACIVVFVVILNKQYPIAQNGIGMYFVFAAVLCNWLAVRFIRRDEKLVRDSERLR